MSRYVIKLENEREFVYGFDHALGYFYEIWDYKRGKEDHECIVEDKSYTFDRLKKEVMLEMMKNYRANPKHVDLLSMDLPF